jgi:hypothetical protein
MEAYLNPYSLDFVEADIIAAPVVKAGRSRAFVPRHVLRGFELAAVFQVGGEAGGAESVVADFGFDRSRITPRSRSRPICSLARSQRRA